MIDFTKPVQTRDGRKVRVLCTDAKGSQPVAALITEGVNDRLVCFNADGTYWLSQKSCSDHNDLVNVPEKRTAWAVIYGDGFGGVWPSKETADVVSSSGRIACVEITYEVPAV